MSGSVNKCIILGNLTAAPEVRNLPSGGKVVNMSVATNESWRDKNTGEKKEKAEFHRVVIFSEGLARVAEQYLKKGSKVYLEGQLQTRKWTDQAGVEKYSTEIVLQGFNASMVLLDHNGQPEQPRQQERQPARSGGYAAPSYSAAAFDDGDGIPF